MRKQTVERSTELDREIDRLERGDAWDDTDQVVELRVKRPLDAVVPVRLPSERWEALRQVAQELGVGPSTLARMWLLERLREQHKTSVAAETRTRYRTEKRR